MANGALTGVALGGRVPLLLSRERILLSLAFEVDCDLGGSTDAKENALGPAEEGAALCVPACVAGVAGVTEMLGTADAADFAGV